MALTRVNRMIAGLALAGYVEVVDEHVRPFAYRLTRSGRDYRERLDRDHFRSVVGSFRKAQDRINGRLGKLKGEGSCRLLLYGAGDVMEVTLPLAKAMGLQVIGIVDDDPRKQGSRRGDLTVLQPDAINRLEPDAVLITTFRHASEIRERIAPELRSKVRVWGV